MEETFCQRRAAEQTAADGTSTLTSDGYLRGITTEVGYVTLYPLKGKDLIQQAIVASVTILRFLGKLRMSHEAEGPRAVFDADNDGYADVLAVDRNDNLEFERHELENVHGSGITMGQAHQSMASASARMASAPAEPAPDFTADEVQVLGVRTIDVEGQPMLAGAAMVDNHFAVAVDATGDGQFDIGIIDQNDDSMFSENEVYDIRDQQVGVREYVDQVENPRINTGFEPQDDATDSGMTADDNLIDI